MASGSLVVWSPGARDHPERPVGESLKDRQKEVLLYAVPQEPAELMATRGGCLKRGLGKFMGLSLTPHHDDYRAASISDSSMPLDPKERKKGAFLPLGFSEVADRGSDLPALFFNPENDQCPSQNLCLRLHFEAVFCCFSQTSAIHGASKSHPR